MTARLQVSGSKLALTRPSTKIKAGNVSTVNVIADKLDVPNNEKAIGKGRLLHCGHFRSNTISTLTARALTESVTQMRMKSSFCTVASRSSHSILNMSFRANSAKSPALTFVVKVKNWAGSWPWSGSTHAWWKSQYSHSFFQPCEVFGRTSTRPETCWHLGEREGPRRHGPAWSCSFVYSC